MTQENNLLVGMMVWDASKSLNYLKGADPSDPIVAEAWKQINRKRTVLIIKLVVIFIVGSFLALGSGFEIGIPALFLFLLIMYPCMIALNGGAIAQQAVSKMQWRQANDIHAMRLRSDADHAMFNGRN